MSETLKSLLVMGRDTLADPKEGARRVLSLPLPRSALWQALGLVVIVSLLLTHVSDRLMPNPGDPMAAIFRSSPFLTVAIFGALILVTVVAMYQVGRLMGGEGSFEGALRLTIWLQLIMLAVQTVQVFFMLVFPQVAALLGLVAFALWMWLMTNFIAVLHGFRALLPVFLMIIATSFVLGIVLFFVLALFGVSLPMEMTDV